MMIMIIICVLLMRLIGDFSTSTWRLISHRKASFSRNEKVTMTWN